MRAKIFHPSVLVLRFLSLLFFYGAFSLQSFASPPEPLREARFAWIASVWNIDYPSEPGLSVLELKKEMIENLELLRSLKMNGIVFQVRPEGDALYQSSLEPTSYWLTGLQGSELPGGSFDPLKFTIEEAHKRGIEVHAWLNPYRSRTAKVYPRADSHYSNRFPDQSMAAPRSYQWFNPGERGVEDQAIRVVKDLVNRYDLDGIHFDDYFYPYPAPGYEIPDSEQYARYKASLPDGVTPQSLGNWRRNNVNRLITRVQKSINSIKQHVKFGVSPFGIWRPGYPSGIEAGLDSYKHIFADSRAWLKKGWVDYLAPQLYWPEFKVEQQFSKLNLWWSQQNPLKRHVWPGLASSRIQSTYYPTWGAQEIVNQVQRTRNVGTRLGSGHIHWSFSAIKENRDGLQSRLKQSYYYPALVPAISWKRRSALPVEKPRLRTRKYQTGVQMTWTGTADKWVIQVKDRRTHKWSNRAVLTGPKDVYFVDGRPKAVSIRAVDRYGVVSQAAVKRFL